MNRQPATDVGVSRGRGKYRRSKVTAGIFLFALVAVAACVGNDPGTSGNSPTGNDASSEASNAADATSVVDGDKDVDNQDGSSGDSSISDASNDADADADSGSVPCTPGCNGSTLTTCTGGTHTTNCAHGCSGTGAAAHCLDCTPTTSENGTPAACGNCGTQTPTRTCQGDGTWGAYVDGTCMGQGVCAPGTSKSVRDHRCVVCPNTASFYSDSTYDQQCTGSCTWGSPTNVACGTPCTP